jgi:hypothetical protein
MVVPSLRVSVTRRFGGYWVKDGPSGVEWWAVTFEAAYDGLRRQIILRSKK